MPSRGSVLDENALFDALKAGTLAAAALDVFTSEPYQPRDRDKDLRTLPNAILTPHLGSSTKAASVRIAKRCLHNIRMAVHQQFDGMDLLSD